MGRGQDLKYWSPRVLIGFLNKISFFISHTKLFSFHESTPLQELCMMKTFGSWVILVIVWCLLIWHLTAAPLNQDKTPTLFAEGISKNPAGMIYYVNSKTGNDSTGTGAETKPFKTITAAVNRARSGDTVMVESANTYDAANGEIFPIRLKSGMTLTRKKVTSSGSMVPVSPNPIISGGARYDIPDSPGGRYPSIIGADNTVISSLSFSIVNSPGGTNDGTAVLCDGTSPTIEKCSFSGTAHAGITTLGTAHPRISDNNFAGNLNWGITAYGESYPTISKNTFSTLNGIDCTASSHPSIENNKISCGSAGISTKGSANPTITDNTLNGNGDYGIIVRMDSTPAIQGNTIKQNPVNIYIATGGATRPDIGGGGRSTGGNIFQDNSQYDIENRNTVDIMATGNTWGTICCEDISSRIYDKEDNPMYGAVSYGTCTPCRIMATMRPPL